MNRVLLFVSLLAACGSTDVGIEELAGVCSPASEDGACAACAKQACCEASLACFADTLCLCFTNCLAPGNTRTACTASCHGSDDGPLDDVRACLAAQCATPCRNFLQ